MFVSPLLNELLEAELSAGNTIAEYGPGFGGASRLVILAERFRTGWYVAGPELVYRDIHDEHY